jgi:hypothetical protein
MPCTILNPAGNWDYWIDEMKLALDKANNNTNVGEKLVFENEYLKLWTIHLAPDKNLPFHKHTKKYIWTVLSTGKTISYKHDGSVRETIYNIGDYGYNDTLTEENCFIHNLINTGETTLIFSTIEFKK